MNLLLQDQVALVTGSSRGIGLAVAEMLALEGVTVILNGVNEQRLAAAVSLLTAKDLSVIGIPGDVSDKHTAERIFSEISRQHERFDILVNNAGIYPHGSNMLEMSEEHWDQAISVNLKSVFNCSRLAAQAMIRHGNGGVILNAIANKGFKSSRILVIDPHGEYNSVLKGKSNIFKIKANGSENEKDLYILILAQIAMRRVGQASEVAAPLVFLASPLSSYITGANLEITGGKFVVQNPAQAWQ